MLKILKYMKAKEWLFVCFSLAFVIVQVYLDLKMPDYMKQLTILVQTPDSSLSEIFGNGGYMLICAFGSLIASILVGFFAARIAAIMAMRLRGLVYGKVMAFSEEEINKFSTSSLINRTTNDITQVQTLIAMGLQAIIKAPITAVWAIVKISDKSWQWTAATGVAVAILIVLLMAMVLFALPKFKKVQTLTDNLNRVARENLTGIKVVRSYNAEAYQEKKFKSVNTELTNTNLFINRTMAFMMPGMTAIMSGLTLSIYWIGAYLLNAANFSLKLDVFSDMMIFSSYAMQILMSFMMLILIFILLPRATVSAKRINEVLVTVTKINDGAVSGGDIERIAFEHVSFKYPEASDNVLNDINFTAERGQKIAIIGATGSGKSTLVNLIMRFYDVTDGGIKINDTNIKEFTQKSLRNKIGYVSQQPVVFSGTISSNVAFGDNGKPAGDSGVAEAVDIAQANDFVDKMEDKYSGKVSQGGANLSGGQKQRLSIARAVNRNPDIFIFDDSFSALDYKTDLKLRNALNRRTKKAITFIVAQRIGTIRDADKILVMDEGRIAGEGTHSELMKTCAIYQEIAYSQLSQKELL